MNTYHTFATLGHAAPLLPVEVTIDSPTPIRISDLNQFLHAMGAATVEDAADQLLARFGGFIQVVARVEGVDITVCRETT